MEAGTPLPTEPRDASAERRRRPRPALPGIQARGPWSAAGERSRTPSRNGGVEREPDSVLAEVRTWLSPTSVGADSDQQRRNFASQSQRHRRHRRRAERAELLLNSFTAQLVLLIVSVLYCAGLAATWLDRRDENHEAEWIAITGAILISCSVAEFSILVTSQAGVCRFWLFFWPLFHKMMTVVFLAMLLVVSEATFVKLALAAAAFSRSSVFLGTDYTDRFRITIATVLFYRFLRGWAIRHRISVQATMESRRRSLEAQARGIWADEHRSHKLEYYGRRTVKLQALLDHRVSQGIFLVAVVLYGVLYAITVSFVSLRDLAVPSSVSFLTKPAGYALLSFLAVELVVRCLAQEGERFFTPLWHKVEVGVLLLGFINLGWSSWYSNAIRNNQTTFRPWAALTAGILLLHRVIRIIGLKFHVNASTVDPDSILSGAVKEWLRIHCSDALDIPGKNIRLTLDNGVRLIIYRAMVKQEVIDDLHLPVTLRGVYLEELDLRLPLLKDLFNSVLRKHVRMPNMPNPVQAVQAASGAAQSSSAPSRSVLRLTGAVILLQPGEGLREAGIGARILQPTAAAEPPSEFPPLIREASGQTCRTGGRKTLLAGTQRPSTIDVFRTIVTRKAVWRPSGFGSEAPREERPPAWTPSYWVYERLLAARSNMVELICGQFPWALQDTRGELQHVMDRCFADCELDVRAARVQYSDPDGALQDSAASISLDVGTFYLRVLQGTAAVCDITRVGLRVEMEPKEDEGSTAQLSKLPPREVLRHLRAWNARERFRAWSLEAAARQLPLPPLRRHRRAERWDPPGAVLSLLWSRLRGGAERSLHTYVGETRLETEDREVGYKKLFRSEKKRRSGDPQQLSWRLQTHPLRVAVDGGQVRCLQTLFLCAKAWTLRDYAYRWRPNFSPSDADLSASERRTVVRLWWLYSLHRVLADLAWMSPRAPWIEGAWLSANRSQYASILPDLYRRRKLPEWQARWQKELQLQLPFQDVMLARAAAFLDKEGLDFDDFPPVDIRAAATGHHTVFLPAIEVRVLQERPRASWPFPRAVLCDLTLEALAVDAEVPPVGAAQPWAATLTVGGVGASCYAGEAITLGMPERILWCAQPLAPRRAEAPLIEGIGSSRQQLTVEARVALQPGADGVFELRIAPLEAVVLEPLVVELTAVFAGAAALSARHGVPGDGLWGDASPCANAPLAEVRAPRPTPQVERHYKLARRYRLAPRESLTVASGRLVGALVETFELFDAEAAVAKSSLCSRAGALRDVRAAMDASRLESEAFAFLTSGSKHSSGAGIPSWRASVEIGRIRISQLGEYSAASLLSEDFELGPIHARGTKPADAASFAWEQLAEGVVDEPLDEFNDPCPLSHVSLSFDGGVLDSAAEPDEARGGLLSLPKNAFSLFCSASVPGCSRGGAWFSSCRERPPTLAGCPHPVDDSTPPGMTTPAHCSSLVASPALSDRPRSRLDSEALRPARVPRVGSMEARGLQAGSWLSVTLRKVPRRKANVLPLVGRGF